MAKNKKKKNDGPNSSKFPAAPPPSSSCPSPAAAINSPATMLEKEVVRALEEDEPRISFTSKIGGKSQILEKSQNLEKFDELIKKKVDPSIKFWTSLFKDNRSPTSGVPLTKVTSGVSSNAIKFKLDEFEEDKRITSSLIGFFSPKFPGLEAIKKLTEKWKYKCTTSRHVSTWIVFTFSSKEEALGVLEAGPYQSIGSVLHLRTMPKFFNFSREEQSHVPVWAQFPCLPLDFWTAPHLSKLCTFIGTPLHTDRLTESRERIRFARCLIQVDVNVTLPESLPIEIEGRGTLDQLVFYESKPISCSKCKRLGHAESACKDMGLPALYTMRKPIEKAGNKKKVNVASAEGWVEMRRKHVSKATITVPPTTPTVDAPIVAQTPTVVAHIAATPVEVPTEVAQVPTVVPTVCAASRVVAPSTTTIHDLAVPSGSEAPPIVKKTKEKKKKIILTEVARVSETTVETTVLTAADSSGSVTLGTEDSTDADDDYVEGSWEGSEAGLEADPRSEYGSEDGDKEEEENKESEEKEEEKKDEEEDRPLEFLRDLWESPNKYRWGSGQRPMVIPPGYSAFIGDGKWVMMKDIYVPKSLRLAEDDEATSDNENG